MKNKPRIKPIVIFLVLSIFISLLPRIPVEVSAEPQTNTAEAVLDTKPNADSQILEYVDENVFASANHLARLQEEETLNSYVFLNSDGSKTAYYMDENIKYVDTDGTIREKNISLTAAAEGFTTVSNDVKLLMPDNLSAGVQLAYRENKITLTPVSSSRNVQAKLSDGSVVYPDFYGKGISLVYTPTLSGVKEDIILENYSKANSFTFTLKTGGLSLYEEDGRYYIAAFKTAKERFVLGEVIAFDATGRFCVGTLNVETVQKNEVYHLTVSVDDSFLTDPNTTYPVSIDPTITVQGDTATSDAIEDAGIFSNKTTTNSGTWTYNHCGYYDSTYGIGRIAVRLKGLINNTTFQNLTANQINSVHFYMREATGTAASQVNIHALMSNSTWTETGVNWNNIGTHSPTVYASASPAYNSTADFDITTLVKAWKNTALDPNCGFIMIGASETTVDKNFYTSETASASNRPYVVVNYTDEYVPLFPDGVYRIQSNNPNYYLGLTTANAVNGATTSLQPQTTSNPNQLRQLWKIKHIGNDRYSIRPLYRLNFVLYENGYDAACIHDNAMLYTESGLIASETWQIVFTGGGYALVNCASGQALYPDGGETFSGNSVGTAVLNDADFSFYWSFLPVNSPPTGILLFDETTGALLSSSFSSAVYTKKVELGSNKTLSQLGFKISVCDASGYDPSVTWSSSDTSFATVNASTGEIVTGGYGFATITASKTINGAIYQVGYRLEVLNGYASVQVLYDEKYGEKYPNASSSLTSKMEELQEFYLKRFGLVVAFSTPTEFQSYADACDYAKYNEPCECGDCENSGREIDGRLQVKHYHHTNINNMLYRLPSQENVIHLAFSGHDTCDCSIWCVRNSSGDAVLGVADPEANCAYVSTSTFPDASEATELLVAIHEFGHLVGARDHYGTNVNSYPSTDAPRSDMCIYGNDRGRLPGILICDACRELILEELAASNSN